MEIFAEYLVRPLTEPYFQKALLGAGLAALVCSVVGSLVILRKMAFLGDALSHAMIAGVGVGYLVVKFLFGVEAHTPSMLLGALLAAVITSLLVGFISRVSRIKEDTSIGIVYCGIFAAGAFLVSVFQKYIHIDLIHFIMGDVLGISDKDLWLTAIVSVLVLTLVLILFRQFKVISFDPVSAVSFGIPVILLGQIFTLCVSLVVVSAVSMVGVILVVGFLITPAATAYLVTDRLSRMMFWAPVFGVSSVLGGLYFAVWFNAAGAASIMLFCTLQFVLVLIVAPQYGLLSRWQSRRNVIPQAIRDDILLAVFKTKNALVDAISPYVHAHEYSLKRLCRILEKEGLLAIQISGELTLTAEGEKQALQLLRTHRLWEAYLHKAGIQPERIHDFADKLEHIDPMSSAEYLASSLDSPKTDPHGQKIPEKKQESSLTGD